MGISTLIWNAVLADLRHVKVNNGYEITFEKVYDEPVSRSEAVFPHVALIPYEGGNDDEEQETIAGSKGAIQSFTIKIGVRSTTPHADLLKAHDATRNSLERSEAAGGNTIAVTGTRQKVWKVDVTGWEFMRGEGSAANEFGVAEVEVAVHYYYQSGSA